MDLMKVSWLQGNFIVSSCLSHALRRPVSQGQYRIRATGYVDCRPISEGLHLFDTDLRQRGRPSDSNSQGCRVPRSRGRPRRCAGDDDAGPRLPAAGVPADLRTAALARRPRDRRNRFRLGASHRCYGPDTLKL